MRDNDNNEENKQAQTIPHAFWESEEWLLDERSPDCFYETRDGTVGNEPEDGGGGETEKVCMIIVSGDPRRLVFMQAVVRINLGMASTRRHEERLSSRRTVNLALIGEAKIGKRFANKDDSRIYSRSSPCESARSRKTRPVCLNYSRRTLASLEISRTTHNKLEEINTDV